MKQMVIKKTNDVLYYDTLDNGLQIFMIPKVDLNNVVVSLNVKYGAIHNEFVPIDEDKMKRVPNGIAHFLEHKMFEQENGIDPMIFYSTNGADVNAYTSLYNTSYYFSCSNNVEENLEYLLNFVQSPYFTDENVNKEKGIIEEEIKMYNDDPYTYLDEGMRLNVFENHSLRYPIAGSADDIKAITKEDLYTCYNTFYHPSNMFIVIIGKMEVDEIFNIIKTNQEGKQFKSFKNIIIKKYKEKEKVVKAYEEKIMSVEVPKISLGLKIPLKKITMDPKRRDLYLAVLFASLFGATSLFNEEMKDKGYLLSYIDISTFYTDDYLLVVLSADTEYPSELLEAIKSRLTQLDIEEEDFNNKVKVMISSYIYLYEDIHDISKRLTDDLILYGKFYPNVNDIINSLNMKELKKLINNLNLENTSTLVICSPKK